jgi:hypothetical protein
MVFRRVSILELPKFNHAVTTKGQRMDRFTPTSQAPGPPRAAAIAGLIFSLLMIITLGIIRSALPDLPTEQSRVNARFGNAITLALHLVPFAGLAFLWFIGVLRSQMGAAEDQFFATVFLGSGLLFVASLFAATAVAGAVLGNSHARPNQQVSREVYYFAQQVGYAFLNIFAVRMAGVFIFSTCMIALRTGIFSRWIAFSGFGCGLALLLVISNWLWIVMLFPLWTILVSAHILAVQRKRKG